MQRFFLFLVACFFSVTSSFAATNITTPVVAGHWTASGSPYYIYNDISVLQGQSLTIDPGVQVVFQGPYALTVTGIFHASGTLAAPIVFDIYDTTGFHIDIPATYAGGWRGITFLAYSAVPQDTSTISYCHFHHLKFGDIAVYRSLQVRHCQFSENMGGIFNLVSSATGIHEIDNCTFANNYALFGSLIRIYNSASDWYVHNNLMHHNKVGHVGSLLSCENSEILFANNEVSYNTVTPFADTSENARLLEFLSGGTTPCYAVLTANKIYENTSMLSAPVVCMSAIADLHRNYICNNHHVYASLCAHTFGGGGLYLVGNGDLNNSSIGGGVHSLYTVRNNIIANNYSPLYGGGISIYNATALIANNTIVNNKAPRGGAIDLFMINPVSACVRNNILSGNENEMPLYGVSNICVTSLSTTKLKYDYNWSVHPVGADVMVPLVPGGSVTISGNINTNVVGVSPALVSPTLTSSYTESALTADFSLSPSSGVIEKGTNIATTPGAIDYAGNNRIGNNAVDIGAIEYNASATVPGAPLSADTMFKNCCMALPLGLGDVQPAAQRTIEVYPNPASNLVFITTAEAHGSIQISDAQGKPIMIKQVTNTITSFDIHALAPGFYIASWHNGTEITATKRIIVE